MKLATDKHFTDRVLRSVTEHFENLCHFPSGSQVHPETGHGTPCGQADYTADVREGEKETKETNDYRNFSLNIYQPYAKKLR